jgi:hypothetical protein
MLANFIGSCATACEVHIVDAARPAARTNRDIGRIFKVCVVNIEIPHHFKIAIESPAAQLRPITLRLDSQENISRGMGLSEYPQARSTYSKNALSAGGFSIFIVYHSAVGDSY